MVVYWFGGPGVNCLSLTSFNAKERQVFCLDSSQKRTMKKLNGEKANLLNGKVVSVLVLALI